MSRISAIAVFILASLTGPVCETRSQSPQTSEVHGHTLHTLLNPGDIPAIFDPEFLGIERAADQYWPDEPVIVVTADGAARAYSTWHLDHHEIVNDQLEGTAIAVTW